MELQSPQKLCFGRNPKHPKRITQRHGIEIPDVRRTTFAPEVVFWAKSPAPNNEPQRYPEQNFSEVFGISEQTLGVPEQFCSLLKKNRACVQNLRFVKICQAGHSTYIFFFVLHQGTWGRGSRGGVGLSVVIRAPREVVPEAVAACPWSIIYVDHAECTPLMS